MKYGIQDYSYRVEYLPNLTWQAKVDEFPNLLVKAKTSFEAITELYIAVEKEIQKIKENGQEVPMPKKHEGK